MSTQTFQLSDNYLLHVTVLPVLKPLDHYHLKIESQWLRAKDPNGLQTRYQTTLPRAKLTLVAKQILEQCEVVT